MNLSWWFLRLAPAAILIGVVLLLHPSVSFCSESDTAPTDRVEIERAATSFADILQHGDLSSAQALFATRATPSRSDILHLAEVLRSPAATSPIVVSHLVYLRTFGVPRLGDPAPCGANRVALGTTGATANVRITNATALGLRTTEIWMERAHGRWRVLGVTTGVGEFSSRWIRRR